ncbi:MAG: hypothetical protein UW78_C0031G0008, partial [Candidatus Azambacteria bacterium GW2011_GWA1_44_9]
HRRWNCSHPSRLRINPRPNINWQPAKRRRRPRHHRCRNRRPPVSDIFRPDFKSLRSNCRNTVSVE